eukprot:symbB.v1.2.001175.t1/scaffold60.1/size581591/15
MQEVRRQTVLAREKELFRSVSSARIVSELLRLTLCSSQSDSLRDCYYDLPVATDVDLFVSHSWSFPAWRKVLLVCHHLNLDVAMASSISTSVLGTFILGLYAGSVVAVAKQPAEVLYSVLYALPLVVFLVAYFFAHIILDHQRFWFDRLCVYQGHQHQVLKAETITAIPAFIAQSKGLLVLWDESYFERMWCSYELAVHAKTCGKNLHLVPFWMPLWTLLWLAADTLVGLLSISADASLIEYGLFGLAFAAFNFQKLTGHKVMLEQMSQFHLRNVHCSVESDRAIIETQILNLFDEALQPPLSVSLDQAEYESCHALKDLHESDLDPLMDPDTMSTWHHVTSYPSPDEVIEEYLGQEEFQCVVVFFNSSW